MAIKKTDDTNYQNIANAIRAKSGSSGTFLPSEMAAAISGIPTVTTAGQNVSVLSEDDGKQLFQVSHNSFLKIPNLNWSNQVWAHGLLYWNPAGRDADAIHPDFNSVNSFRICAKFKMVVERYPIEDYNAIIGAGKDIAASPIPEIFVQPDEGYVLVDLVDENGVSVTIDEVGSGDLADFIDWNYVVLSAVGTEIRLYLYDKNGVEIDHKSETNFKMLANTSPNLTSIAIGGTKEDPSVRADGLFIDLTECFVEGNGVKHWGSSNDITENLGIFQPAGG